MKYLILSAMILTSSISRAERHDFNLDIQQASLSQQRLHRQLLRILQGFEVSIAENEVDQSATKLSAAPEFKIHLVTRQN
jgi:hypothetical protein